MLRGGGLQAAGDGRKRAARIVVLPAADTAVAATDIVLPSAGDDGETGIDLVAEAAADGGRILANHIRVIGSHAIFQATRNGSEIVKDPIGRGRVGRTASAADRAALHLETDRVDHGSENQVWRRWRRAGVDRRLDPPGLHVVDAQCEPCGVQRADEVGTRIRGCVAERIPAHRQRLLEVDVLALGQGMEGFPGSCHLHRKPEFTRLQRAIGEVQVDRKAAIHDLDPIHPEAGCQRLAATGVGIGREAQDVYAF
ncbi:MAG: hypothetical protein LKM39_09590 [Chiayiivirga sp.]|nr:hypothetical protein [Chiayiivirga sp.]